jgi:GDP-L-fucose synthase
MAALIRKFHEAKRKREPHVVVWGTGAPRREFLHVDDMTDACVYLMENYDASDIGEFVNIGVGEDVTIKELAEIIGDIVGYNGEIVYDTTKPDGTPQKLLDVSRLRELGWGAKISLRDGIKQAYDWYVSKKL